MPKGGESIKKLEASIKEVSDEVTKIKDNHLAHISIAITQQGTDLAWLKRFFFIIATAVLGTLATGLLNLFLLYNNR